jgi:two-component system chemotaxis response regulator CheB
MGPIRVLVVDDSAVARRCLTEALGGDAGIEVAGTASNGHLALSRIEELRPDVVTLDVEMPEMGGLEALQAIRARHPRLPVIMVSSLTERGAGATLDSLYRGASDYVTKPRSMSRIEEAMGYLRCQLIPKVKALAAREAGPSAPAARALRAAHPEAPEAIVVGASTGGPNALLEFLEPLPAGFPSPILVVQHMPPIFTRALAERLASRCRIPVREASGAFEARPGECWIAAGDFHLEIARRGRPPLLAVHQGPPENSCRPSVDVLFRSAARTLGPAVVAVVLTGMGQDGLLGSRMIREAGGAVFAQDEASSVVWGMPGAVARAGLAEALGTPGDLARQVLRRVEGERP